MDGMPDVGRIRTHTRERSKSLLGTQFRAEVGGFIAIGEAPFWARAMADQLDIPENKVSAELSRFAANNLLTEVSRDRWDRRRLFQHTPGSDTYWAAALAIVVAAARDEALRIEADADEVLGTYLRQVYGDEAFERMQTAGRRHGQT
jgi:hypothetical protein